MLYLQVMTKSMRVWWCLDNVMYVIPKLNANNKCVIAVSNHQRISRTIYQIHFMLSQHEGSRLK